MHFSRFLLLFLFSAGCRCTEVAPDGELEPSTREVVPDASWTMDVPKVDASEGNLAVVVKVSGPEDAPEQVWAGLTAEKPDGTAEDTPMVAIPRTSLGTPVTLNHAIGEGFTTFAIGVWASPPPPCAGEPDCVGRLQGLPAALVTWPAQPTTSSHPMLDKIAHRVRVRFVDLSRSGSLSKVVRETVATRLAYFYPGPEHVLSIESDAAPGDPRAAVLVRYRDPSDDAAAESVAIDLRKALAGAGVVTEHAPELPVAFVVDMGGDPHVSEEHTPPAAPRMMRRPGG